jgi:hypothetical protein
MTIDMSPIQEPPFIIGSSLVFPPEFQMCYENEKGKDSYQSDCFKEVGDEYL